MVGATHYILFLKVLWLSALITLWGRNKRPLVWNTAIKEFENILTPIIENNSGNGS
jgi:hypothetical protein